MIKDILTDIVAHTKGLGFLEMVKVTGSDTETKLESMADDKSVVLEAKMKNPVSELEGVFGMRNLDILSLLLKSPEYKENFTIKVVKQERNGETIPTGLHFQNATGDFENDYRFMNQDVINEKLKTVKFKGTSWEVEFEPTVSSIQRLKYQAAAHTEEQVFQVSTNGSNLVFSFGDASTHAGSFTFQSGITGKLKQTWSWPVNAVQAILALSGDITMKIADAGALAITIDSGVAVYEYILPAQSK